MEEPVAAERPKHVVRRVLKGYRDGEGVSNGKSLYARTHGAESEVMRDVQGDGDKEQQHARPGLETGEDRHRRTWVSWTPLSNSLYLDERDNKLTRG
jgi:hypothetical protein